MGLMAHGRSVSPDELWLPAEKTGESCLIIQKSHFVHGVGIISKLVYISGRSINYLRLERNPDGYVINIMNVADITSRKCQIITPLPSIKGA